MTFTELSLDELADPVALLMSAFFTTSEASKGCGASLYRTIEASRRGS
jgi:hypothetical protein